MDTKQTVSVANDRLQAYGYFQRERGWSFYNGTLFVDVQTHNQYEVTNLATRYRFPRIGGTVEEARVNLHKKAEGLIAQPISPLLLRGH